MNRHLIIFFTGCFLLTTHEIKAVENSLTEAAKKISGQDFQSGLTYSAQVADNKTMEFRFRLNEKTISMSMGYGEKSGKARLIGVDARNGQIVNLSRKEAEAFSALLMQVGKRFMGKTLLEESLLRTVNLLADWPVNLPLNYSLDKPLHTTPYNNIPGKEAEKISDICGAMNLMHSGGYPVWGTWRYFEELGTVGPYPWNQGDCLGRCGVGCPGDGQPDNSIYVFSQDCFNHDACVRDQGTYDVDCDLIFFDAIGDFLYGPSCQKDNVDIVINGQDQSVVILKGELIDISVSIVNAPSGVPADFWLYAETTAGTYWYTFDGGWQLSNVPLTLIQRNIINRSSYLLFHGVLPPDFPMGASTFYFAADTNQDGVFSGIKHYEDALEMTIQ